MLDGLKKINFDILKSMPFNEPHKVEILNLEADTFHEIGYQFVEKTQAHIIPYLYLIDKEMVPSVPELVETYKNKTVLELTNKLIQGTPEELMEIYQGALTHPFSQEHGLELKHLVIMNNIYPMTMHAALVDMIYQAKQQQTENVASPKDAQVPTHCSIMAITGNEAHPGVVAGRNNDWLGNYLHLMNYFPISLRIKVKDPKYPYAVTSPSRLGQFSNITHYAYQTNIFQAINAGTLGEIKIFFERPDYCFLNLLGLMQQPDFQSFKNWIAEQIAYIPLFNTIIGGGAEEAVCLEAIPDGPNGPFTLERTRHNTLTKPPHRAVILPLLAVANTYLLKAWDHILGKNLPEDTQTHSRLRYAHMDNAAQENIISQRHEVIDQVFKHFLNVENDASGTRVKHHGDEFDTTFNGMPYHVNHPGATYVFSEIDTENRQLTATWQQVRTNHTQEDCPGNEICHPTFTETITLFPRPA